MLRDSITATGRKKIVFQISQHANNELNSKSKTLEGISMSRR